MGAPHACDTAIVVDAEELLAAKFGALFRIWVSGSGGW
jgi:hypothetical protein